MNDLLTRKQLSEKLGIHYITLANWIKKGTIIPEPKEKGKPQLYSYRKAMLAIGKEPKETYTLVFINDLLYKSEMHVENDSLLSKQYCVNKGWNYKVVFDSPLNPKSDGKKELIKAIFEEEAERIILPSKSKIGYGELLWIKQLCEARNIPLIVLGTDSKESEKQEQYRYALIIAKSLYESDRQLKEMCNEII